MHLSKLLIYDNSSQINYMFALIRLMCCRKKWVSPLCSRGVFSSGWFVCSLFAEIQLAGTRKKERRMFVNLMQIETFAMPSSLPFEYDNLVIPCLSHSIFFFITSSSMSLSDFAWSKFIRVTGAVQMWRATVSDLLSQLSASAGMSRREHKSEFAHICTCLCEIMSEIQWIVTTLKSLSHQVFFLRVLNILSAAGSRGRRRVGLQGEVSDCGAGGLQGAAGGCPRA